MAHHYQVAIIGAGVSGAALAYALARYSGVTSIAVLEKANEPASVNSAASQNSQTLHCGDIETNYTLEKAAEVKRAADMLACCVSGEGAEGILYRMPKMVLGVGEAECAFLRERHARFRERIPTWNCSTTQAWRKPNPGWAEVGARNWPRWPRLKLIARRISAG